MQTITLNLVPDGACEVVHVNQYDVGREFIIRFRDDGVNAVINNPTVKINGRKSDQHAFLYTESDTYDGTHPIITKSGSGITFQVSIKTTEQMTAATGDVLCQLTLEKTGSTIGTLNFILRVQEQPYATGDASETELPSIIAEATEQMEAAAASAQQAEDAVAHYPYINSTNKDWMVYDAEQGEFVDTGVRAQGIDGSGAVQTVDGVIPDVNGNVDLKWADMSSVSNLAITEETRTMTSQRVAGSYVFVKEDDQLYEITTTIDPNGTLTPGTNATARSVGYVLEQLNSDIAAVGTVSEIASFPFSPTKNGLIVLSNITPNATGDCYLYMKRTRGTTTVNFRYRAQHTGASGYGSMTIPVMAGDTVTLDTASTGTTYTAEIVAL